MSSPHTSIQLQATTESARFCCCCCCCYGMRRCTTVSRHSAEKGTADTCARLVSANSDLRRTDGRTNEARYAVLMTVARSARLVGHSAPTRYDIFPTTRSCLLHCLLRWALTKSEDTCGHSGTVCSVQPK